MNHRCRLLSALLLAFMLNACAGTDWTRNFYEGMRVGADNAARQPGGRAVPQNTPLPNHDQYERERQRLRGAAPDSPPDTAAAAASAAAR